MKKQLYLIFISTLLFSCGTKSDRLQFSEFEIKDGNGVSGIAVNKLGNVTINEKVIGEINEDGTLNDKDGKLLAKLTDGNILQDKNGNSLIKIDAHGKMDNGSGMFIEWSKSGELMRGNENTGMRIIPVEEKSFQAASIVLYLYLNFE